MSSIIDIPLIKKHICDCDHEYVQNKYQLKCSGLRHVGLTSITNLDDIIGIDDIIPEISRECTIVYETTIPGLSSICNTTNETKWSLRDLIKTIFYGVKNKRLEPVILTGIQYDLELHEITPLWKCCIRLTLPEPDSEPDSD